MSGIGSSIWTWRSLTSASEEGERSLFDSLSADILQRQVLDSTRVDDLEEPFEDEDVNYTISEDRVSIPKDLNYVVEMLEKQAFTVELLQKQLNDSIPPWATDILRNQSKLAEELRQLRRTPPLNSAPSKAFSLETKSIDDTATCDSSAASSVALSSAESLLCREELEKAISSMTDSNKGDHQNTLVLK